MMFACFYGVDRLEVIPEGEWWAHQGSNLGPAD